MRPEHQLAMNVNFSASDHLPEVDLYEAYNYGVRHIRLNIISYQTAATPMARWKAITQQALDIGYESVIFGFSSQTPTITSSNIANFKTAVIALAGEFQAIGDPRLILQIGNEEELHHDGSLTDAQIRSNMRDLATSVKAVYTVTGSQIIYSSTILLGTEVANWASEGRGDIDIIAFNLYGSTSGIDRTARLIYSSFGEHGWVTEWGMDEGFESLPNEGRYTIEMRNRMKFIKQSGIPRIYYYNWMESNNKWGIKIYPDTDSHHFHDFFGHWLGQDSYQQR